MAKRKATKIPVNDLQRELLKTYALIWQQAEQAAKASRWPRRRKYYRDAQVKRAFLNDLILAIAGQKGVSLEIAPDGTPTLRPTTQS
jgi:hypothetical protein